MKEINFTIGFLFLMLLHQQATALPEFACDSIRVRYYSELDMLNNCTVVIGNVILSFPLGNPFINFKTTNNYNNHHLFRF
jgi:hypothetical protein